MKILSSLPLCHRPLLGQSTASGPRPAHGHGGWAITGAALLAALLAASPSARAQTADIGNVSPSARFGVTESGEAFSVGYGFTVGGSALTVSSLGVFQGSVVLELGTASAHEVTLFSSTGTALATVTVPAGTALNEGFEYATLSSPLLLAANTQYFIEASFGPGNVYTTDTTDTVASGLTVNQAVSTAGTNTFAEGDGLGLGPYDDAAFLFTLAPAYWKGSASGSWLGANWTGDAAGTIATGAPGSNIDVNFSATGATNQGATTLDADFTIHSLTVSDTTPVVINSNAGNTTTHTLTISGNSGTGLTVGTGSNLTVNANVTLAGASNTMEVDGTGQATINGLFSGSNTLSKTGTGTLTLTTVNWTGEIDVNAGAFIMNSGTVTGGDNMLVGAVAGATATATINGGTLTLAQMNLGTVRSATGSVTQNGGAITISGSLNLGDSLLASGIYNLNGGVLTTAALLMQPLGGSATFNLNAGGTLIPGSPIAEAGFSAFNFNGGTLLASDLATEDALFSNPASAIVRVQAGGAIINTAGLTLSVPALQHDTTLGATADGGLLVTGGGTLDLTVPSNYTGGTTIAGATVNASIVNAMGSGVITLEAGELISGFPVVNNVTVEGLSTIAALAGNTLKVSSNIVVTGNQTGTLVLGDATNTGAIISTADLNLGVNNLSISGAVSYDNQGTIEMANGAIGGAGTMVNDGTLSGTGTISAAFSNAADGIVAMNSAGNLKITPAFTNSGLISLSATTAQLSGGVITNAGQIEGFGNVKSNITNSGGTISASGGTLDLSGTVTNSAGGVISATSGTGGTAEVLVAQGLATNAGLITLSGGEFNNNNHALSNTGTISGYGILSTGTGGLTTSGTVNLAGGTTTVIGPVAVTGGTMDIYSTANFNGLVTIASGSVTTHSAVATFSAGFSLTGGTFLNDPSTVRTTDLSVGAQASLAGQTGSLFQVSGNMNSASAHDALSSSEMEFLAPGDTGNHAHAFTWNASTHALDLGNLTLDAGETLQTDNGGSGLLTVDELQLLQVMELSSAAPGGLLPTGTLTADVDQALTAGNLPIYYNPADPANSYLQDQTITYGNGGALIPTPEPSAASLLLLIGLGGLGRHRPRRRAGC